MKAAWHHVGAGIDELSGLGCGVNDGVKTSLSADRMRLEVAFFSSGMRFGGETVDR